MRTIIITLLFALCSLLSSSQGCLPEGITFTTQAEIDNFQTNYPGCTEIEGDVIIDGNDITNLSSLNIVTSIGGDLVIGEPSGWNANPALANLIGLENLSSVGGDLTLESNSILNSLTGLENLTYIGGSLNINKNPLLTNIASLGELTSIGGGICLGTTSWLGNPLGNPLLSSLSGLEGISSLTDLTIIGNHALSDLTGLNNLQSISGSILIGGNETLSSLGGLEELSYIGENLQFGYGGQMGWINNPLLHHLTGLEGLTELGGDLTFSGTSLVDLEGLNNLVTIGNDFILYDNGFNNLSGLDSLISISGNLQIGQYPDVGGADWVPGGNFGMTNITGIENLTNIGGELVIGKNESLISLAGLENVTSIGGDLVVFNNENLTSIAGLENINAGSIEDLYISYNYALTACEIQNICDYLANPNGTITIHDNAPGCDSQEEVEDVCNGLGVTEVSGQRSAVSCFPNPTNGITEFQFSNFNFQQVTLKIYDFQGREVAVALDAVMPAGEYEVRYDASWLPAGVYFYHLTLHASRFTSTGKLVKY